MTREQQAHIPEVLAKGAAADGLTGDVWTSRRLAVAIKREFGVSDHPDHCGYLVRKMGLSLQKPIVRASQRNERASANWKNQQWPRLKKTPNKRSARECVLMKRIFLCDQWWGESLLRAGKRRGSGSH